MSITVTIRIRLVILFVIARVQVRNGKGVGNIGHQENSRVFMGVLIVLAGGALLIIADASDGLNLCLVHNLFL